MSSKITIIAFYIIFHKYIYHQMLKIRKKIDFYLSGASN